MSLYAALAGKGPSGFGYGSTAEDVSAGVDLRGKIVNQDRDVYPNKSCSQKPERNCRTYSDA